MRAPYLVRGAAHWAMRDAGFAIIFFLSFFVARAQAVVMDTVLVGEAGNAPDPAYFPAASWGSVSYSYRIGTYEVTNSQYAEFLNAKAPSTLFSLYNTKMDTSADGGIVRTGSDGSYHYDVKPNMGNKPVNFVNIYDAQRFANWMHNGQGNGDTETGSYTMVYPIFNDLRQPGATWVLPTEAEWYKAAYYDPRSAAQGGPPGDDHYWLYPTGSDTLPTPATFNAAGDISNPGANVANYPTYLVTPRPSTVGSAGPLSQSYYGTSDQAGNVWEWMTLNVVFRGGSFDTALSAMFMQSQNYLPPSNGLELQTNGLGFRLVYIPEPASFAMAVTGLGALAVHLWRRRWPG